MQYRPEIDGLRAVAVIPVILFHAGFEAFSGGFVGVDVFFVISGYLITTIIVSELDAGTFTLRSFYERRARRILPALFFVITCCIPVAWFTLTPNDMKDFAQSVFAAATFSSNILFWRESGYFATAAELKPLLHTWSLAVEEQYYILFPLFMIVAWRYFRALVPAFLALVFVLSFALSQYAAYNHPEANFYLLPTRGWELLIGVFVALYGQRVSFGGSFQRWATWLGMGLILTAVFTFNDEIPFPSVYALAPTIGTALVIIGSTTTTFLKTILVSKVAVGIGLISYSLYLWHQPLLAFARVSIPTALSLPLVLALIVTTILLATLTWYFIEQPVRRKTKGYSAARVFSIATLSLTTLATLGFYGHIKDGFQGRFNIPESVYSSLSRTDRSDECFNLDMVHERDDWLCSFGDRDLSPSLLVFGDSHALSFLPAADEAARRNELSGVFVGASGCTPLLGIHALRNDQKIRNCHTLNQRVIEYAHTNDISTVFLVARWTYYTDGGYDGEGLSYIAMDSDSKQDKEVSREAFDFGVRETIMRYTEAGIRVVFVDQVPQQKMDPLDIYARSSNIIGESLNDWSVSVSEHYRLQSYVQKRFDAYGATRMSFSEVLCNEARCPVGTDSESFYFDDDHLSLAGSKLLVPKLNDALKELGDSVR